MRILKANTAVRLVVGPLCDKTTGLAKTGMTVTNMAMNMWHEHDDGSAPTKSIDAVSFTASGGNNDMVELAGGYYDIEITAAQLNITAGRASFCIYDDDVILPYFEEWLVVPANVFDSIMGTDKLDVNLTNLPSIPADWLTASGVKADAVTKIQNGLALEATLTAIKGAGWTDETLAALMTAIEAIDAGSGSSAEEIWEYASRTLTQSAASVAATVAGSTITAIRGDTLSAALENIGALTNYSKLWFTVKADEADTDATAQVQIELAGGLLYINGAAATTAANGSITINDESTGDVTILLKAPETAKLSPGSYYYDIQILRSTGILVSTLTSGMFVVAADVTRATS